MTTKQTVNLVSKILYVFGGAYAAQIGSMYIKK